MAESYRLMAASAKEHGLRSADGTCLLHQWGGAGRVLDRGRAIFCRVQQVSRLDQGRFEHGTFEQRMIRCQYWCGKGKKSSF